MTSLENVLISVRQRQESDEKRYQKYFGIDAYDPKNFDYIIDTTKLTEQEVFDEAYKIIRQHLEPVSAIDNLGG